MSRLVIDSGLHLTPYGDDEVFVRHGSRSTFSKVLRDDGRRGLLVNVVRHLLEPRDRTTLAGELQVAERDVAEVVDLLLAHGVAREWREEEPAATSGVRVIGDGAVASALVALLRGDGIVVRSQLDDGSTSVAGDPDADGSPDAALVAEVEAAVDDGDLVVLALDHLRPAWSLAVNEVAVVSGVMVLHLTLDGPEVLAGPLVVPGETACYTCYDIQDEGSRHLRHDFLVYKDHLSRHGFSRPVPSALAHLAASWAALAVEATVAGQRSFLHGRSLRIDADRSEVVSHRVLQLPRCPVCIRARHELRHVFL